MTDSTLIWRDSSDNIKGRHQFSIYLGLFAINLFLVMLIIAFILSGDFLALILVILLIILDILQLKGGKIQPFEIYTDKIIYSNIKHGGTPELSWGGPNVTKIHIYFSNIEKLGAIGTLKEWRKPFKYGNALKVCRDGA